MRVTSSEASNRIYDLDIRAEKRMLSVNESAIHELCSDLLEARELIKEMRSKLLVGGIQATEDMTMFRSIPVDIEIISDLIKRTKEYAE